MPEINENITSFEELDPNHDGNIDEHDYRRYVSNNDGRSSSTYERSSTSVHRHGISDSRLHRDVYEPSPRRIYVDSSNTTRRLQRNAYTTRDSIAVLNNVTSETVIETSSSEETDRYLERAGDICRDPDPIVTRKTVADRPVTYQQRVLVRYLQPPEVQPAGPLIIKEVREPQLGPLPPLVIRQYQEAAAAPPPLILRERPPVPPPAIPSETIIRRIPALPPPPRSVIIERYPAPPPKPRDIIIERWLPYSHSAERRTIVEEAPPPPPSCRDCRNQIIIYDRVEPRIVRRFEQDGVVREDPAHYIARYGDTLLDSTTLIEMARNAGVVEDLSVSAISYSNLRSTGFDYEPRNRYSYADGAQYITSRTTRRRGLFDFSQYGLLPSDYTAGMTIRRKFVRPTNFVFPSSSMWSIRTAKYKEQVVDGRITSVTVELIEDGVTIHSRTITKEEYNGISVTSSAPKLAWNDFLQVLQVFMLGNNQEQDSDISRAFDILDQGRRGLFDRADNLSDGLISPDELRAFLSILTDEYRVDLCVFLADTDGSGQISLSEFTRMVRSGLARDIICDSV